MNCTASILRWAGVAAKFLLATQQKLSHTQRFISVYTELGKIGTAEGGLDSSLPAND